MPPKRKTKEEHSSYHLRIKLSLNEKHSNTLEPNFSDARSIITFFVGPDREEFIVHKEFLCRHSALLQKTLENDFSDDQTQVYTLDHTSPAAFRFLLQWIYQQRLDVDQLKSKTLQRTLHPDDKKNNWLDAEDKHLVELWVLADKLAMPALQNAVMDAMVESINLNQKDIPCHTFRFVWENTVVGSALRKWCLRQCWMIAPEGFRASVEYFDMDMLVDYAEFVAALGQGDLDLVGEGGVIDGEKFHVCIEKNIV